MNECSCKIIKTTEVEGEAVLITQMRENPFDGRFAPRFDPSGLGPVPQSCKQIDAAA